MSENVVEKKNVSVFNADVKDNQGYRYTTNAPFSSIVANKRITEATIALLDSSVKSLVDIGCGDGAYTIELADARPKLKVAALDPAADAIAIAKKKRPDIDFYVANLLVAETLKKEKYDTAVVRGVLHHLTDPALAIENAARTSDRVIIIEPNGNNPILKLIEKTSKYHIEHEERSFSSAQLCKWCEEKGLKIEKLQFIGFVPFFFPTFPARVIYFFQPLLEKIPLLGRYFGAQIVILCTPKR